MADLQADPQYLSFGVVLLLASAYFAFVSLSPEKRTRLAPVAAGATLLAGATLATLAFLPIRAWRGEVASYMTTELLFNLFLSYLCLAQAGTSAFGRRRSAVFAEVAERPRLGSMLAVAPVVLLLSWLVAFAVGLVWPFPALSAFEPAEPLLIVFRGLLLVPQAFYCALVGWLFLKATGPHVLVRRLRAKNLLFSIGAFAWFVQALNSASHGMVRVLLPDGTREAIVLPQMYLERFLFLGGVAAFAVGLTVRYAPTIGAALVRRVYPALLGHRERFEIARWGLATGSKKRGLIHARHHAREAGLLLKLSEEDLEKVTATVELTVILADPTAEARRVGPDNARDLLSLQKQATNETTVDGNLVSMAEWSASSTKEGTVDSAVFHEALRAAVTLVSPEESPASGSQHHPLWYHLACIAVADAELVPSNDISKGTHPEGDSENSLAVRRARQAYLEAKAASERQTIQTHKFHNHHR